MAEHSDDTRERGVEFGGLADDPEEESSPLSHEELRGRRGGRELALIEERVALREVLSTGQDREYDHIGLFAEHIGSNRERFTVRWRCRIRGTSVGGCYSGYAPLGVDRGGSTVGPDGKAAVLGSTHSQRGRRLFVPFQREQTIGPESTIMYLAL